MAAYNAVFPPAPPASADLAWLATRPNPLPDWRTYRGATVRDANGTLCEWRDVAGGYVPAGSVLG